MTNRACCLRYVALPKWSCNEIPYFKGDCTWNVLTENHVTVLLLLLCTRERSRTNWMVIIDEVTWVQYFGRRNDYQFIGFSSVQMVSVDVGVVVWTRVGDDDNNMNIYDDWPRDISVKISKKCCSCLLTTHENLRSKYSGRLGVAEPFKRGIRFRNCWRCVLSIVIEIVHELFSSEPTEHKLL